MKLAAIVVAVVLASACVIVAAQECPEGCLCSDGSISVARCNQLQANMYFPERVKHLVVESVPDLQLNLTKSFFRDIGLQQVTSIKITNCTVSNINVYAFEGLQQLTDVILSDNRIVLIHPDTFQSNGRLQTLILSGNPLELTQVIKSEEGYFLKSSSLLELDLSRCQIGDIDKSLLSKTPNLQYINLKSNEIKVINDYIFENTPYIDEVDLSYNMLMAFDDEIFEDIDDLTTLNLQHNLIENIDDLDLPGLKELDLSSNRIKLLKKNTFEGVVDISSLNISYNEITWISEETFKDLTELRHLDLSHNSLMGPLPKFIFEENVFLETLKLGGNKDMHVFEGFLTELPRLYLLDISQCGLHNIANSSFNNMPNLAILNMSTNSLTALNHVMLSKLHRLNDLDISNNKLSKVGTYTFASNSHLRKLNLSNNKLHNLSPNTFEATPHLSHLDISNNQFSHIWHLNESEYMKNNSILKELLYLNIADNRIQHLHKHSFSHLISLKVINVQNNPLECASEFPAFIEWLYINHIEPFNFEGKSAEQVEKVEALTKSSLQWNDLLITVCKESTESVGISTKPLSNMNILSKKHNPNFYQYIINEDIKSEDNKEENEDTESVSIDGNRTQDKVSNYIWPTFLIVFSIVFLTLAIGNTVALLIYKQRNHYTPEFRSPFKRTVVKLDATPRYHKLYEECSVPNPPAGRNVLLGKLISSQISGATLMKPKNNDSV